MVASDADLLRLLFALAFAPAYVAASPVASAVIVRLCQAQAVAPSAAAARQMIASGLPWLLVVAFSRSAYMQKQKKRVFVVFVFILTKISIISAILYPKTYKM